MKIPFSKTRCCSCTLHNMKDVNIHNRRISRRRGTRETTATELNADVRCIMVGRVYALLTRERYTCTSRLRVHQCARCVELKVNSPSKRLTRKSVARIIQSRCTKYIIWCTSVCVCVRARVWAGVRNVFNRLKYGNVTTMGWGWGTWRNISHSLSERLYSVVVRPNVIIVIATIQVILVIIIKIIHIIIINNNFTSRLCRFGWFRPKKSSHARPRAQFSKEVNVTCFKR